jgi:hypothetical protein
MSVYVDTLMHHGWKLRGKIVKSCHMWSDTPEESHTMGRRIGLLNSWYQHGSIDHYDLTESRRVLAVQYGAIECDRDTAVAKWREMQKKRKQSCPPPTPAKP